MSKDLFGMEWTGVDEGKPDIGDYLMIQDVGGGVALATFFKDEFVQYSGWDVGEAVYWVRVCHSNTRAFWIDKSGALHKFNRGCCVAINK